MNDPLRHEFSRMQEENTLESYLIGNSSTGTIGAYSENDMRSSVQSLQARLRSMGVAPIGDLFRSDLDSIKATIKSVSDLISMVVHGQDAKGNSSAKHAKLQNDLKLQIAQYEKLSTRKKVTDHEIVTLTSRIKKLESDMTEKKKHFQAKAAEYESEKTTWDNKYKLFSNELKKRDNAIKKLTEIGIQASKDTTVLNSFEVTGDLGKQAGGKVYGSSEVEYCLYSHTQSSCHSANMPPESSLKH